MTMAKTLKLKVMVPIEVEFSLGDGGKPTAFDNPNAMKYVTVCPINEIIDTAHYLGTMGGFNIIQKPLTSK